MKYYVITYSKNERVLTSYLKRVCSAYVRALDDCQKAYVRQDLFEESGLNKCFCKATLAKKKPFSFELKSIAAMDARWGNQVNAAEMIFDAIAEPSKVDFSKLVKVNKYCYLKP